VLWLSSIAQLTLALPGGDPGLLVDAGLLAVVAVAVVAVVAFAALLARQTARPVAALHAGGRAVGVRHRAMRAAYLRQRDPDAAGRPRPRAPSA
jgi:hypothetical protein